MPQVICADVEPNFSTKHRPFKLPLWQKSSNFAVPQRRADRQEIPKMSCHSLETSESHHHFGSFWPCFCSAIFCNFRQGQDGKDFSKAKLQDVHV